MRTSGPRVLAAVGLWIGLVAAVLLAAGSFTPALAFLLAYLGYVVAYLFVEPAGLSPQWRRVLVAMLVFGALGTAVIIGFDVVAILE
ncbi:hypothetical protein [Halapricum hydrolyticum]|uniref:Uncharacterized protein n=1 Tax=Halapricum hydrolyticum TaxID=2979991 RepID=A0AAE3LEG8_9EURY|nr:hypothetical protein [Halapricum hydrolyticum]MCU4718212.1 hypothetical protein [Halapricum hydrolyticum]MCU4726347.1 hypothetical protein [Halapricum hydrolyticum]